MHAFLDRPIEGAWPYLWIDATYVKVRAGRPDRLGCRDNRRRPSTRDGRREVLGMAVGAVARPRRSGPTFLRSLTRRGLRGVKLVISDAHEGLKAAAAKVLGADLAALPRALHAQRARRRRIEAAPRRR